MRVPICLILGTVGPITLCFGFEEAGNALALEGAAALWAIISHIAHVSLHRKPGQVITIVRLAELVHVPVGHMYAKRKLGLSMKRRHEG